MLSAWAAELDIPVLPVCTKVVVSNSSEKATASVLLERANFFCLICFPRLIELWIALILDWTSRRWWVAGLWGRAKVFTHQWHEGSMDCSKATNERRQYPR